MNNLVAMDKENISNKIYTIRGHTVMLDRDLAELYQVETKNLNRAVTRNIKRFPQSFRFQLTEEEYENLRFQIGTSSSKDSLRFQFGTLEKEKSLRSQIVTLENGRGKHRKYLPYVFTEQGVSSLSAVLSSKVAVEIHIKIIRAFVEMRKIISSNSLLFFKMEALEKRQISYEIKTDTKIEYVLNAHDRFMIIDNKDVYHIGASLKDLGNKWFAFSKFEINALEILGRLKQ
ncbi:MAG: ORF6N domain-containing protein [Sulfurimonas sp.]|jgi:phage regulator Rha-like protein